MENQLFKKLDELPIIICTQCQHGVWPKEVQKHLTGSHHNWASKQAKKAAQVIQSWEGIEWDPAKIEWPKKFTSIIPELEMFSDGLLCQMAPGTCFYIGRTRESLRQHWWDRHHFSIRKKPGWPSQLAEDAPQLLSRACKQVCCYQLFPSRQGSHYIEVDVEDEMEEIGGPRDPRTRNTAISMAIQDLEDSYQQHQEQLEHLIEAGEKDEVNPWLRRTQWPQYLQGLNRDNLLSSIQPPSLQDEPSNQDPMEQPLQHIWEAMEGLIHTSQVVASQQGHIIRMAAIRTQQIQNRYEPLQAYMNQDTIVRHMRPWQQILMFFARTQLPHEWESLGYQFTPWQWKTWRIVWE